MLAALFFPYGNGGSSILRSIDEPDVDLLGEKYEVFSEVGMDDKRHAMNLIAHDPSVPSVWLTAGASAAALLLRRRLHARVSQPLRCPFKMRKVGTNVGLLVSKRSRPREVLWKNVHVGPALREIKQSWSAANERALLDPLGLRKRPLRVPTDTRIPQERPAETGRNSS